MNELQTFSRISSEEIYFTSRKRISLKKIRNVKGNEKSDKEVAAINIQAKRKGHVGSDPSH